MCIFFLNSFSIPSLSLRGKGKTLQKVVYFVKTGVERTGISHDKKVMIKKTGVLYCKISINHFSFSY